MSHESAKKKCELQNNAKKEKEQDNIMQQNNFTSLCSSHVSLAKFISQFLEFSAPLVRTMTKRK